MDAPVLKVRRTGHPFRLRRAPAERRWMDESEERYAYRCLPLAIANQLGWEVLCPADLAVMWNGGKTKHDIVVGYRRPDAPQPCISHFGEGVVTFNLGALFTTNPGWQLQSAAGQPAEAGHRRARGRGRDRVAAVHQHDELAGHRAGPVDSLRGRRADRHRRAGAPRPARGRPGRAARPGRRPGAETAHDAWSDRRQGFLDGLEAGTLQGWQKGYTRGVCPVAGPAPEHRTKLRLAEPLEAR